MKKRKIIIIIAIIVICIAILVGVIFVKKSNGDISYYMIHDGYDSIDSKIISSYEEYQDFAEYIDKENNIYGNVFDFNTTRYNNEYFDTKSLAVINITGSGTDIYKDVEFHTEFNKLICDADIEHTDAIEDIMGGKIFLVEIDKNITDFIINK